MIGRRVSRELFRLIALRLRVAETLVWECGRALAGDWWHAGASDVSDGCAEQSGRLKALADESDRLSQSGDESERRSAEEARSSGYRSVDRREPIVSQIVAKFPQLRLPSGRGRRSDYGSRRSAGLRGGSGPQTNSPGAQSGRAVRQGDRRRARAEAKHSTAKKASLKGAGR